MFRHILLATDGSECARKAALVAADLALKFDAELTALFVFVVPAIAAVPYGEFTPAVPPGTINEWERAARETAERRVDEILRPAGVRYSFREETGHPAETIVRIAGDEKCDLIVIGSRGLSGIKEFLLGSVSSRVSHHAHCPVLIVR